MLDIIPLAINEIQYWPARLNLKLHEIKALHLLFALFLGETINFIDLEVKTMI